MKKSVIVLKIVIICLALVFLPACDVVSDVVDWIESLYDDYFSNIICWLMSAFAGVFSSTVEFVVPILTALVLLLPDVEFPDVDISDIPFLPYAAYFLPISEAAILIKYLVGFYTTFFIGRIILRWLKVLRS
jgi:hypothetical protein